MLNDPHLICYNDYPYTELIHIVYFDGKYVYFVIFCKFGIGS